MQQRFQMQQSKIVSPDIRGQILVQGQKVSLISEVKLQLTRWIWNSRFSLSFCLETTVNGHCFFVDK